MDKKAHGQQYNLNALAARVRSLETRVAERIEAIEGHVGIVAEPMGASIPDAPTVASDGTVTLLDEMVWTDATGKQHVVDPGSVAWTHTPDIKAQVREVLEEHDAAREASAHQVLCDSIRQGCEERGLSGRPGQRLTEIVFDELDRLKAENAALRKAKMLMYENLRLLCEQYDISYKGVGVGAAVAKELHGLYAANRNFMAAADAAEIRAQKCEEAARAAHKCDKCTDPELVKLTAEVESLKAKNTKWATQANELRVIIEPMAVKFAGPPWNRDAKFARLADLVGAICGALEHINAERIQLREETSPELARVKKELHAERCGHEQHRGEYRAVVDTLVDAINTHSLPVRKGQHYADIVCDALSEALASKAGDEICTQCGEYKCCRLICERCEDRAADV